MLDPVGAELVRRDQADSPESLDRQRPQERRLPIGLDDEQAVGLGGAARHLGEHLRPGDADGDRQSDSLPRPAPQPLGDLPRCPGDPLQPAHVEERLLHARGPRRAARSPRTGRTAPCSPPCRRRSAAGRRRRAGRAAAPALRPSRRGSRRRAPRSSPPSPLRRRRSSAGRAGADRPAAPPRRRTHRRQRAGSTRRRTRTYVRIGPRPDQAAGGRAAARMSCRVRPAHRRPAARGIASRTSAAETRCEHHPLLVGVAPSSLSWRSAHVSGCHPDRVRAPPAWRRPRTSSAWGSDRWRATPRRRARTWTDHRARMRGGAVRGYSIRLTARSGLGGYSDSPAASRASLCG